MGKWLKWLFIWPIRTKKCNYVANDPSNESEVLACSNDYTGCTDFDYLRDKEVQEARENECKRKFIDVEDYENFRKQGPLITLGFYAVLIVMIMAGMG